MTFTSRDSRLSNRDVLWIISVTKVLLPFEGKGEHTAPESVRGRGMVKTIVYTVDIT